MYWPPKSLNKAKRKTPGGIPARGAIRLDLEKNRRFCLPNISRRKPGHRPCEALPECQVLSLAAPEDSRADQGPSDICRQNGRVPEFQGGWSSHPFAGRSARRMGVLYEWR